MMNEHVVMPDAEDISKMLDKARAALKSKTSTVTLNAGMTVGVLMLLGHRERQLANLRDRNERITLKIHEIETIMELGTLELRPDELDQGML